MAGSNTVRSPHYGALQDVVDSLYLGLGPKEKLRRLDIVVAAEAADLPDDLAEIVNLLPPGSYTRQRLCDQLNSATGRVSAVPGRPSDARLLHARRRPTQRLSGGVRPVGGRRQAPPAFARGTRGYTVNRPPRPVWPIDTPLRTACSASTICSLS